MTHKYIPLKANFQLFSTQMLALHKSISILSTSSFRHS